MIRDRPGFVSARLLVAATGARVINEAVWTNADAVAATADDPDVAAYAARVAAIASPAPAPSSTPCVLEA